MTTALVLIGVAGLIGLVVAAGVRTIFRVDTQHFKHWSGRG